MFNCARTYKGEETKSHIVPRLFCSLSGCYCMYTVWKHGKYEQSDECVECPRYKGMSEQQREN